MYVLDIVIGVIFDVMVDVNNWLLKYIIISK